MKHHNGNLLCAIDTETTGLRAPIRDVKDPHDLIQVAILPVAPNLTPSREFPLFHMMLQPKRDLPIDPQADKINKGMYVNAKLYGMEPWTAVDRFEEWFQRLRLPPGKKIIPLGCNFANFDKYFIMDWLGGPLNYEYYFRSDIRDVQTIAAYLNDRADSVSEMVPFPKWNLSYLAATLKIHHETKKAHDAVQDCVTTINVYKKLLEYNPVWLNSHIPTP